MAQNNFEKHIKEKFSSRTIDPSNDAWSKLESQLATKKRRHSFKNSYWVVAAIFIGVIVVLSVVNTGKNNVDRELPLVNEEKVKRNSLEKKETENVHKDPILVFENKEEEIDIKLSKEKTTTVSKEIKQIDNAIEAVLKEDKVVFDIKEKENKLIDLKVDEVLLSILELNNKNGSVTDAEIDELLLKAQKEISTQRILNNTKVDATALLLDVEEEIDKSFRDRVFKAIKNGYLKVKTAVAERNH